MGCRRLRLPGGAALPNHAFIHPIRPPHTTPLPARTRAVRGLACALRCAWRALDRRPWRGAARCWWVPLAGRDRTGPDDPAVEAARTVHCMFLHLASSGPTHAPGDDTYVRCVLSVALVGSVRCGDDRRWLAYVLPAGRGSGSRADHSTSC